MCDDKIVQDVPDPATWEVLKFLIVNINWKSAMWMLQRNFLNYYQAIERKMNLEDCGYHYFEIIGDEFICVECGLDADECSGFDCDVEYALYETLDYEVPDLETLVYDVDSDEPVIDKELRKLHVEGTEMLANKGFPPWIINLFSILFCFRAGSISETYNTEITYCWREIEYNENFNENICRWINDNENDDTGIKAKFDSVYSIKCKMKELGNRTVLNW